MTPTDPSLLEAALEYSDRGWSVIPLQRKKPLGGPNGVYGASSDPAQVKRLFAKAGAKATGVAIATGGASGLLAIDVDPRNGGTEALAALEREHGLLPTTVETATGDGGRHLFFVANGERPNSAKLAPGVDVRGDGLYVVAPPSLHPNGSQYAWAHSPAEAAVAPLPPWIASQLRGKNPQQGAGRPLPANLSTPAQVLGRRRLSERLRERLDEPAGADASTQLFGLECSLFEAGLDAAEVFTLVREAPCNKFTRDKRPDTDLWDDVLRAGAHVAARSTPVGAFAAVDVCAFVDGGDGEPEAWVVSGVLAAQERLILTGPEGGGKSTLLRQIAVQVAAGIHPFTLEPMPPVRVLLIDFENPARLVRNSLRALVERAGAERVRGMLSVASTPQGADLLDPANARALAEAVSGSGAALVVLGPTYKCFEGDPNAEEPARKLTTVLDRVRSGTGAALILEAHQPHGTPPFGRPARPYGASLWMRWCEFGLNLAPSGELTHWRGPRAERAFPAALARGPLWPWQVATNDGSVEDIERALVKHLDGGGSKGVRACRTAVRDAEVRARNTAIDAVRSRLLEAGDL